MLMCIIHMYRVDTYMFVCTDLLHVWRTVSQTSVELRTLFSFFTDFCQAFGRHKRSRCRETLRSSVSARTCQEKQKLLKKFHLRKESIFASIQKEKQTWSQKLYWCETYIVKYSQRHDVINYCDRRITCLGDLDIAFVLLNIDLQNFFYI